MKNLTKVKVVLQLTLISQFPAKWENNFSGTSLSRCFYLRQDNLY